jgi:putative acetyltransferase
MPAAPFTLRRYAEADEAAAIELWRRTWQLAYPQLDFTARVAWWRERWRNELVRSTIVTVAERNGALLGFVTVDPTSGYLDQIVVAPETWGSALAAALLDEAKRIAPGKLE